MQNNRLSANVFTFFFLTVIFISCQKEAGISEEKMVDIITDIQLSQSIYELNRKEFTTEESKEAMFAGILKKHNVTDAEYDSALVWYSDHVDKLIAIDDSVKSRLSARLSVIQSQNNASGGVPGMMPQRLILDMGKPIYSFNLTSYDLSQKSIDPSNIKWSFNVMGLSNQTVTAGMQYIYSDTTITVEKSIDHNGIIVFTDSIGYSSDLSLTRLNGFVRLKPQMETLVPVYFYNMKLENEKRIVLQGGQLEKLPLEEIKKR